MIKSNGFTLLEVLIAVSIIAMAFVALFTTTTHVIGNQQSIMDKTYASWIADNLMQQTMSHLYVDKDFSEDQGEVQMGFQTYTWTKKITKVEDTGIETIKIELFKNDSLISRAEGVGVPVYDE